jgi:hypothetical protein
MPSTLLLEVGGNGPANCTISSRGLSKTKAAHDPLTFSALSELLSLEIVFHKSSSTS